jgi:7-cyano-7-deazaguanine synthase
VLLFSGGIDSTLCALQLDDEGYEVHLLSVHYDRRPRNETRAARSVARALRFATWHEIRLRGLAFGPPPDAPRARARSSLEGVIAHRNLVFWSLAANRAAMIGARTIAAGHTREDARSYTDADPVFFRRLRGVLDRSGIRADEGIEVRLPLQEFGSRHWRRVMSRHRAVIARTWSCWRDGDGPCGECFACRQRFRVVGALLAEEGR